MWYHSSSIIHHTKHHNAHLPLKSSCRSCGKCGKQWQSVLAPFIPMSFAILTHITHHTSHITPSSTSTHTLTMQVKLCEVCQVWQAVTQWLYSLNSNLVVCTHTYHISMWHHTSHQGTHQCTHSQPKLSCVSCGKCGKHWLSACAPSIPMLFSVLIHIAHKHTQTRTHTSMRHHTPGNTLMLTHDSSQVV